MSFNFLAMYFLNILTELGFEGVNTGSLMSNIPGKGPPGINTFNSGGKAGPQLSKLNS